MASWKVKGFIHKVLAKIPFGHAINEVLQVTITGSLQLTQQRFENKLNDFKRHWEHYHRFSTDPIPPKRVLELGSGWYPMTPIGMFLHGVDEIWTCDIAPLLKPQRIRQAMERTLEYHDDGRLAKYWPGVLPEKIAELRRVAADKTLRTRDALLGAIGVKVLVRDAQSLPLESSSLDIITSYGVLMHIPEPILHGVLKEFRRLLKPSGVTTHWTDLCDLYYWGDSSISPLNFYRFSSKEWERINDPITPSNRLRPSDYQRLFAECGYEVTEETYRRSDPAELDRVPLADHFKKYSREELLVLDIWLAARPTETRVQPREQVAEMSIA